VSPPNSGSPPSSVSPSSCANTISNAIVDIIAIKANTKIEIIPLNIFLIAY
jgi:hypothetical protein